MLSKNENYVIVRSNKIWVNGEMDCLGYFYCSYASALFTEMLLLYNIRWNILFNLVCNKKICMLLTRISRKIKPAITEKSNFHLILI